MPLDLPSFFLIKAPKRFQLLLRCLLSCFLAQPAGLLAFSLDRLPVSSSPSPKGSSFRPDIQARKRIFRAYGDLPMSFEKNEGQTDPSVRFLAKGRDYHLFLTPAEAVLRFRSTPSKSFSAGHHHQKTASLQTSPSGVIRMRFQGANRLCRMEGLEELKGKSNYFIGNNPDHWRKGVAQYAQVKMEELYPGVDMLYYGDQRKLEYDFWVKPGADPKAIRLKFTGAKLVKVDSRGALVLQTKTGALTFQVPAVYQVEKGEGTKIQGKFVKLGRDEAGFEVQNYDRAKPLVIDPILAYSTYLGGSGDDNGMDIVADALGNAYVTGTTDSPNFPTTGGAFQTAFKGGTSDAFVTKLNPTGSAVVYSTYLGGNGEDDGFGVAIDGAGNAYVTGATDSSNFPTTGGAYQTVFGGGTSDAFVAKLNPAGNALVYSTYLGGSGNEQANGIAVDGAGNAYVTGYFTGSFPVTPGAFQTVAAGVQSSFVTKLNPAGSALLYSTYVGGSGNDMAEAIAVNAAGNVYITGPTTSPDFPLTPGAYQTVYGATSSWDVFVTELNPAGSALVYSTYLGENNNDASYGIALDAAGDAYIIGSTGGNFPTTAGAYETVFPGGVEVFVTKLNPNGTALIFSTYLGGGGITEGGGIAVDPAGNVYATGLTSGSFPTTAGAYQTVYGGGTYDGFMTIFNPLGTALIYSTYLGGSGEDSSYKVALDPSENIYLTGYTSGNFPTTAGAFQVNYGGGTEDAFVMKFAVNTPTPTISPTPTLTFTPTFSPTPICQSGLSASLNLFTPQAGQPLTLTSFLCFPGACSVMVYNSAGEHIRTLGNYANQPAGSFQLTWDGKNKYGDLVASGTYILRLVEPTGVHQARVLLVR